MYETMKPEKRNLIIEQIIRAEWEMLQTVDAIGGKPGCTEQWQTFRIMRYSYYHAWSNQMLRSYLKDLDEAFTEKRNLVMEKYAYMMEYTDPDYYRSRLAPFLPVCGDEKKALIDEITEYIVECDRLFALQYPRLSSKSRPVEAQKDNGAETSAETYTKGELRTYSIYTLKLFAEYIITCKAGGVNFAFLVKEKMVTMYGYASLEDAERKM